MLSEPPVFIKKSPKSKYTCEKFVIFKADDSNKTTTTTTMTDLWAQKRTPHLQVLRSTGWLPGGH